MHAHARSCHRDELQAKDLSDGDDVDDARERTTASTNMEWCIRDASQIEVTK